MPLQRWASNYSSRVENESKAIKLCSPGNSCRTGLTRIGLVGRSTSHIVSCLHCSWNWYTSAAGCTTTHTWFCSEYSCCLFRSDGDLESLDLGQQSGTVCRRRTTPFRLCWQYWRKTWHLSETRSEPDTEEGHCSIDSRTLLTSSDSCL